MELAGSLSDFSGFAIYCSFCNTRIDIPAEKHQELSHTQTDRRAVLAQGLARRRRERSLSYGALQHSDLDSSGLAVMTGKNRQRGKIGMLDDAPLSLRNRWISRAILEVVLVCAALIVPQLIVYFSTVGEDRLMVHPLASLIGGVLVFVIAATAPSHSFSALRRCGLEHYALATMISLVMGFLAIAWTTLLLPYMIDDDTLPLLTQEYGLLVTLFMLSICPAVFEEIGFRGLLQSRLSALYGLQQGMWISSAIFALVHGVSMALPFHFGLGALLAWLRIRSASLWPCMLLHALYNAVIICWWAA